MAAHLAPGFKDYWPGGKLKAELGGPFDKLWSYAYGKFERVRVGDEDDFLDELDLDDSEDEKGHYTFKKIPGKLRPPLPNLEREIQDIREPLADFLSYVKKTQREIVIIFDGLDRLLDATKFWSVVHQDLRLLRQLKILVLATAPLSLS